MERGSRKTSSSSCKIPLLHALCIFFSLCSFFCSISSTSIFSETNPPFSTEANSFAEGRRFLRGVGSSPPRCMSRCGKCTPCKAVHVPVPPGTPVTAEYYPEAWRCKCGNRLYMP